MVDTSRPCTRPLRSLSSLSVPIFLSIAVHRPRRYKCLKFDLNLYNFLFLVHILIVKCGEKSWRILDAGAPGSCNTPADFLTVSEMTISAGLQDCGMEGDWLIYSNKLVSSLGSFLTLDGVLILRRTRVVVTIACHYKRVSAEPLSPTWLPMTFTIGVVGLLHFSLNSNVYQQGEPLLLEAAVHAPLHPRLRIYVDLCVATVRSDPLSKPSYEFIADHGCLVDSLLPNSSSKFHRRPGENVLLFSIQAFQFPQDQGKRVAFIFISCHLRATLQHSPPDVQNKACYFHGPSFRSVFLLWDKKDKNMSLVCY
uniref:Zona pellucida sperm-binding protein 3 n=1 Tax=Electrophorus electricus TaxID=8005 RepID=A0A4W4G8Y7_ELEEL